MNNNTKLSFSSLCRTKYFEIPNRMKLPLRIACLFTACAFVVFGVRRGEALVVQNKAVNICLECIGLG